MRVPTATQGCPVYSRSLPLSSLQLRRLLAERPQCAILESTGTITENGRETGRFSLFADQPRATFSIQNSQWKLEGDWPFSRPKPELPPLDAFRHALLATRPAGNGIDDARDLGTLFAGGWIGAISYDLAPLLEKLPRRHPLTPVPELYFGYHDCFVIEDRLTSKRIAYVVDRFHDGQQQCQLRLDQWCDTLERNASQLGERIDRNTPLVSGPLECDFTPDEYCWSVGRILEYLRAGDIFQANFTQRFRAPFAGSPADVYLRAVERSPAPFGALIRQPNWNVVSTSPERFFLLTPSGQIETCPIKGTRPRGNDPIHDLLLRDELRSSDKDRAELTMIVDLERNDLGKACLYGSVRVARHATVESFSNVHHLVSTIEGTLRPDKDVVDLLVAMFPGGSITGAPKIRAMQIIDELERCSRGIYTGALGYISDHGRADFNIAIRTLMLAGGEASYHVGGGIVIDSDPLSEYRETLAKGIRLREILLGDQA